MVIGAVITLIVIILIIIIRIRRTQSLQVDGTLEQKVVAVNPPHPQGNTSKPLLRSISPREVDERDPDVIPAKYGMYKYAHFLSMKDILSC